MPVDLTISTDAGLVARALASLHSDSVPWVMQEAIIDTLFEGRRETIRRWERAFPARRNRGFPAGVLRVEKAKRQHHPRQRGRLHDFRTQNAGIVAKQDKGGTFTAAHPSFASFRRTHRPGKLLVPTRVTHRRRGRGGKTLKAQMPGNILDRGGYETDKGIFDRDGKMVWMILDSIKTGKRLDVDALAEWQRRRYRENFARHLDMAIKRAARRKAGRHGRVGMLAARFKALAT